MARVAISVIHSDKGDMNFLQCDARKWGPSRSDKTNPALGQVQLADMLGKQTVVLQCSVRQWQLR